MTGELVNQKSSNKMGLKLDVPILVLGASGYVGSRLVPSLITAGYRVRAAGRSLSKLRRRPWSQDANVELVECDVFDIGSLINACKGCTVAYYLIHSMNPKQKNFAEADKRAAKNMVSAAEDSGLERIIYLGGLGQKKTTLSRHLISRIEVGEILQSGRVATTVLRSAMIIGAGSVSFEILRYLVERLPIMITPKWVRICSQPIAISNVLKYLVACLEIDDTKGQTYDIGGTDVLSYDKLMRLYAEEAGLMKRLILPVPVLTPRLSSYWIHLVTPIDASIAQPLAEGLSSEVVCKDDRLRNLIPQDLLSCRSAIKIALDQEQHNLLRGVDDEVDSAPPPEWTYPGDDSWAGGKVYEDHRKILIHATPQDIWNQLLLLGGKNGWYYADWLWRLRGLIDKLLGGVGMRQGRTDPKNLCRGDIIDFWRIYKVEPKRRLLLIAEMKLPGHAILDFSIICKDNRLTELHQIARFIPRGLTGILYWLAVSPLHNLIFNGMMERIAELIQKRVVSGPEIIKR
jgi:uncharacterized protein YbjT (DUF2867 family)